MTDTNGRALETAQAYFEAMAKKDIDQIMSISTESVACVSPLGELSGIQAFRGFHEGFAKMIKSLMLLAAVGDDAQAVIVYSADTHQVTNAVVAELLEVEDGKIVSTRVIYDATPFATYAASIQPH